MPPHARTFLAGERRTSGGEDLVQPRSHDAAPDHAPRAAPEARDLTGRRTGRSQIATALFNAMADLRKAHAISAGTNPAAHLHPEVVDVMREVGIDVSANQPQRLTEQLATTAQLLVTMGCGEACPDVLALRRIEWNNADPKGKSLSRVRAIRDNIRDHVKALIAAGGWGR